MIIGFTGTKNGMSIRQLLELSRLFTDLCESDSEFHHGDCVGADDQAHELAEISGFKTIAHPPTNPSMRAFKKADIILEKKQYLVRNTDIAKVCDVLVAAPQTEKELFRGSGTWSTMRKARKLNKQVIVLKPEGGLAQWQSGDL